MGIQHNRAKVKGLFASARDSGRFILARATPKVKQVGDASIEKVKGFGDKTSETVARGVHKAMGSAEYRKKAEEVNRELERVLRSLEDSIKRRDDEISRLRAHVAELESRLSGR